MRCVDKQEGRAVRTLLLLLLLDLNLVRVSIGSNLLEFVVLSVELLNRLKEGNDGFSDRLLEVCGVELLGSKVGLEIRVV